MKMKDVTAHQNTLDLVDELPQQHPHHVTQCTVPTDLQQEISCQTFPAKKAKLS